MKKLWVTVVLTVLFLAGCSAEKSVGWTVTSDGENSYTLERALPEHGDSGFIKVLYGQKGFFCRMADGSELYYIADLQTGELKKVGEAKNHSLTGRNYAMIGDTMYFYVTVRGSERPKNVLYAVDFSKEWKALTGTELVQGCIIARKEFIDAHPIAVDNFLKAYEESVNTLNSDPEKAVAAVVAAGIVANENLVKDALPRCNITYLVGDEMKNALNEFWGALYAQVPSSVGGALPDAGIFG